MESIRERAHRAWRNAERIKRLSDNLIKIGRGGSASMARWGEVAASPLKPAWRPVARPAA